jgi:SAM-dependent methyltransferase
MLRFIRGIVRRLRPGPSGPCSPSAESVFTDIFRRNGWRGTDSVSGTGSGRDQTHRLIKLLPSLFTELGVRSVLDVPCGDFFWMRQVDLSGVRYTGGDIVRELVERNRQYEAPGVRFEVLDLLAGPLPPADLVLCRDCLVHFSFADLFRALDNLCASGSTYLLTTTFPRHRRNRDIATGRWRTLNLERAPFHFPPPLKVFEEGCTEREDFADKSLGLWRLDDLKACLAHRRAA